MKTIPESRANYEPYAPTGRFFDGRVIVDFIVCNFVHIFFIKIYQHKIKYFEELQTSLTEKLGEENAKELVTEAVNLFSIGSNDNIGGYIENPKMQELYCPEKYEGIKTYQLILHKKGAGKFVFLSMCPLGCIPALRAVNLEASNNGGCLEAASALARAHNSGLNNGGCLEAVSTLARALNSALNNGGCLEAASALARAHDSALKAVLANFEVPFSKHNVASSCHRIISAYSPGGVGSPALLLNLEYHAA
ncbi:hypothetical protein K2173_017407 [Erythroxylum novogranatense]|uniref:Uncharacterized protein n=1 Tax=Erythroxylum novogranatense TaxID=1862640 RepID=A0AAV8TMA7_9ROSI|nr:hypothetical protein K2173_017407 [Erythroxylum novogranatense]